MTGDMWIGTGLNWVKVLEGWNSNNECVVSSTMVPFHSSQGVARGVRMLRLRY